jgi:hypothetical protein
MAAIKGGPGGAGHEAARGSRGGAGAADTEMMQRLATRARTACPECGHSNHPDAPRCDGCGRASAMLPPAPPLIVREDRPLVYLGIGAALAIVFTLTPLLKYMGWFLSSLVHEMGHCAAAWAMGCPSFPAIDLRGHAAAFHGPQSKVFAAVVLAGLAYYAWRKRSIPLGALALAYPLVAFTGAHEWFFLLAGHLSEIAFGGVFFWRALVGGFTQSRPERVLYAACAWYLVLGNVWLSGGLIFSERVQQWYRGSGSFGLTNDYLVLARSLHVGVGAVAFLMLLVALAALPVAWRFALRTAR